MKHKYKATAQPENIISRPAGSLHAQEIDFNDIRTTPGIVCDYDNRNFTANAYDEAITNHQRQVEGYGDSADHQP
jgi:hypothetical protein